MADENVQPPDPDLTDAQRKLLADALSEVTSEVTSKAYRRVMRRAMGTFAVVGVVLTGLGIVSLENIRSDIAETAARLLADDENLKADIANRAAVDTVALRARVEEFKRRLTDLEDEAAQAAAINGPRIAELKEMVDSLYAHLIRENSG